MKKLAYQLVKKPFSVTVLILLQLLTIYVVVFTLSQRIENIYFIQLFANFAVVIYILNKFDNPSYKMTWIMFILGIPVVGVVTYFLFGGRKVPKELRAGINEMSEDQKPLLIQDEATLVSLRRAVDRRNVEYILRNSGFPVYENSKVEYYATGEAKFQALIHAIEKAEKFIFLEYFIIKEGVVLSHLFDLLKQKVKQGVEVKFMYDDAGATSLPHDFVDTMRAAGIQTAVFNPIRPVLAIRMNNRDHRKIAVIDGKIGFIGGTNIADEYVNIKSRFGHWKDTAISIEGEAVYSLSLMFLQFFDFTSKTKSDYLKYKIEHEVYMGQGMVQPFSDSPTDEEAISENAHLNLINTASHYLYIMTPYLVIGFEMETALCNAAKSGIDVRILVPGIPDKKYVYSVTRSNYERLTKNGVKIYEYTPGFVHGKVMVADGKMAIVGTSNLDFRSYYLHFECGALIIDSPMIEDIVSDYVETLNKSKEITYDMALSTPWIVKVYRAIMNIFAALF